MKEDSNKKLEVLLAKAFDDVRNSYYRPPVEGPEISWHPMELEMLLGSQGTALYNWLTSRVTINAEFVQKLAEFEDLEVVSRGLFTHEIGHYMLHPRNLSLNLYLCFTARKNFKELAGPLWAGYTDFQDNNLVVEQGINADDLKQTLKATFKKIQASPASAAIFLAYNKMLGLGLDIKLKDEVKSEIRKAVKELEQITITSSQDYGLQYSQFLRFANALKPLLELHDPDTGCKCGSGRMVCPEDVKALPQDLKGKVEDAIRQLSKHLPKDLYEEVKKHYLGEEEERKTHGKGIGAESEEPQAAELKTIEYYKDCIRAFGYYVKPKRSRGVSTVTIPFGKKDFRPGDNPLKLDLRFSGGKILPGLTKTTLTEKIPYPASTEVMPRLLLEKDVSGSMPDPRQEKCHGTIAAGIIAKSYLESGSEVGVVLFDSSSTEIVYGKNQDELLKLLCSYKGGGTSIDMEKLREDLKARSEHMPLDARLDINSLKNNPFFRKYLRKEAKIQLRGTGKQPTDLVIITDGGIANIEEMLDFCTQNPNYRPTIIHTGGFNLDIPGYDQQTSGVYEGITVLKAESPEDIIEMAKKTTRQKLLE